MKIAFLVNSFPKLSETFILNQITGLLDRGHKIDIYAHKRLIEPKVHPDVQKYKLSDGIYDLSYSKDKYLRIMNGLGLFLRSFPKNPKVTLNSLNALQFGRNALSLKLLSRVSPFLDQDPYDIVHCHFGPNGNLALTIKEVGAITGKIITTFYGYDISSYLQTNGRHIYDHLFEAGDLFLCISQRMKDDLVGLGCREEKIRLHRLGINTKRFSFSKSQPKPHGKVQLLSIARLVEKKGIQYGIRSVASLLKKFPNIQYDILGDGPLKNTLDNLIRTLKAEENIRILGWMQQEEIVEWLYKADLLLVPSITSSRGNQEGTPTVIIEGLARGLPVVSTYHAGIPELIQDGKSGMLVPEQDVTAMADRLEYLINHPDIWPCLGRQGRCHIERYHNIDKLNDQLAEIYRGLIDEIE